MSNLFFALMMSQKEPFFLKVWILFVAILLVLNPLASTLCAFDGFHQNAFHEASHAQHQPHEHSHHSDKHSKQHPSDCCDGQHTPLGCGMVDSFQWLSQSKSFDADLSLDLLAYRLVLLFSTPPPFSPHRSTPIIEKPLLLSSQTLFHQRTSFII